MSTKLLGGTVGTVNRFRSIFERQTYLYNQAGNGTTDVVQPERVAIKGWQAFLVEIQLDDTVTAAAANVITKLDIVGHFSATSAVGEGTVIQSKKLTGQTSWNGKAFLEVSSQHVNAAIAARRADPDSHAAGTDINHIDYVFRGQSAVDYVVSLALCEPTFCGAQNVLESFTPGP